MDTIEDVAGLVSIGQLAKAAGVSSRTIRYYEELGILPEPRRTSGGTRKYPREYCGYIETALALKDLGFRLEEVKPLARLALGRTIAPGQRARAAQLVEDRIQALDRQVAVLRKLRECVDQPDGTVSLDPLALRNGSVAWPALCSLSVADPAAPRPVTGTRSSEAGMTDRNYPAGVHRRPGDVLPDPGAAAPGDGQRDRPDLAHHHGRGDPGRPRPVRLPDPGQVSRARSTPRGQPTGSRRSGISNQTALPSRVGREPHRVAS